MLGGSKNYYSPFVLILDTVSKTNLMIIYSFSRRRTIVDIGIAIKLGILVVLLVLSALFSSAETALTSLNLIKIKQLKKTRPKEAKILESFLANSEKILATILIGNNVVNIGATSLATEVTLSIVTGSSPTLIVTAVMTTVILIFGEITPKTYSTYNAETVALKLGRPIEILSRILNPISKVLNYITRFFIRLLGGNAVNNKTIVSEEEIITLVDVGEEAGIIEKEERDMIESIFEIGELIASDVMVPRIDIIYLEKENMISDAINLVIENGYSRIPVIEDSIDDIIGIIYAKDLLLCSRIYDDVRDHPLEIKDLMRKAYYVPESKKVVDLLKEMQINKTHIAIVLDEYGGTLGLITIEDILEEIVGDILDEFDEDTQFVEIINVDHVITASITSIEEINEILNVGIPEDDFESIGGFVFNLLGRIPEIGDEILYNNFSFIVLDVENRRINKIEIKKLN